MAQIKKCDRCKKEIIYDNHIGVTLEAFTLVVKGGLIRPSPKLLGAAKEADVTLEYFPLTFEWHLFGEIDLCSECFAQFMELKTIEAKPTPIKNQT